MDTHYIGTGTMHAETRERGRFRAEFQVESADGADRPLLDVRLHHVSSSAELASVELNLLAAKALRNALDEWIREVEAVTLRNTPWTLDALRQLNEPQVRELGTQLDIPGRSRMTRSALIEAIWAKLSAVTA